MAGQFEIYKDKSGKFRWRLIHSNGQLIANSGKGYTAKQDAAKGIGGTLATIYSK